MIWLDQPALTGSTGGMVISLSPIAAHGMPVSKGFLCPGKANTEHEG